MNSIAALALLGVVVIYTGKVLSLCSRETTLRRRGKHLVLWATNTEDPLSQENATERLSPTAPVGSSGEIVGDTDPKVAFLDGQAKIEEPGDRDKIMKGIQEFQLEMWKQEEARIPTETIVQRSLDTVEDAYLHLKRVPYDKGWLNEPALGNRKTVVVLGSGWAAHAFLKIADTSLLRIIVVSPSNHFVFTPMLASACVGTVEYRSMTEAVRAANPMIENYIEGTATNIDVEKQCITVQIKELLTGIRRGEAPEIEIDYDQLVVAVGCKVADSLVPGAFENCLRLKSCDDARRLRNAIGEAFEYASRPEVKDQPSLSDMERDLRRQERRKRLTFCIIGGGPTGVELSGELSDFIKDITKPRTGAYPGLLPDVRILLVHGGDDLVPQFDKDLREHALKSLSDSGVEVRLNTKVTSVVDGLVTLVAKKAGSETEIIPSGVTVWAAGTEAVPFTKVLLAQLPAEALGLGGKIVVDRWLRCPMPEASRFGSILVMGDAASFADGDSYLPQTAQVAGQQGAYTARILDRGYDLSCTPPQLSAVNPILQRWLSLRGLEKAEGFQFLNLGLLAYVGGGQALTQVQIGDVPVASYAGSISFVLWRSVYLVKQVATRNRVLVTFDWMKSAIFGRDITRL